MKAFAGAVGVILLILASIWGGGASEPYEQNYLAEPEENCVERVIPYETVYLDDDELDYGETFIHEDGYDGTLEICYDQDGNKVSENITDEPTEEVIYRGTYLPTYESFQDSTSGYSERRGAICMDGTTSTATGSGACSWHGGVSEWLY